MELAVGILERNTATETERNKILIPIYMSIVAQPENWIHERKPIAKTYLQTRDYEYDAPYK